MSIEVVKPLAGVIPSREDGEGPHSWSSRFRETFGGNFGFGVPAF
jgi:hypothetical protein